jgi:hypothetical protein
MFFKNLLTNYDNILDKKTLNTFIYGKHLIRFSLENDKNFLVLENNSKFLIFSKTKSNKLFNFYFKNKIGLSYLLSPFFFKHSLDDSFSFNSFLPYYFFKKDNKAILNLLKTLKQQKFFFPLLDKEIRRQNCLLFFLNPKKGGFNVFSFGQKAFFPRRQFIYFFKRLLTPLYYFKAKRFAVPTLNFVGIKHSSFYKKYFIIRFPFKYGNFTLYMKKKKRFKKRFQNLKTRIKKKKKKYIFQFNFVFLKKRFKRDNLGTELFYEFLMANRYIFFPSFFGFENYPKKKILINKIVLLKVKYLIKKFYKKRKKML